MPAADPGDADLFARWGRGDRHAGDVLYRRHYPSIRRFFDLRLPHLADDLTQQTFVAMAEHAPQRSLDAQFKPYLFGIARNLLLLHLRRASTHDRVMHVAQEDSTARTSLSVVAVRREEEVLLLMAMTSIPTDYQIALELYYWESMTTVEIGAVLGANPSTIGSRLARARELLIEAIMDMTRPGALRDKIVLHLDELHRGLGPPTLVANRTPEQP